MLARHRFAGATVALGVALGFGMGVAQAQTMRINHTFGVDSFPDQALKTFAKGVQDRTGGAISVTLFSAGELGQELEQYDLMEVGALECALMGAQILASVAPEYGAFEMPYLWRDQAHVRNVWSGPIGQEIAQTILDRKGIRVIAVLNRGARNLTANKAIKTPADLQGLKIRTTQNAVHVAAWEAIGAVPTPMPFGEVFMGLRQGIIEGQENPVDLINSASFFEVQKYLMLTEHVRSIAWLGVSEKWFKSQTPEHQKIILEEAEKAGLFNDDLLGKNEGQILEQLSQRMTVIQPGEIDLAAFRDKVSVVPGKFADVWKPGLYDAIVAAK